MIAMMSYAVSIVLLQLELVHAGAMPRAKDADVDVHGNVTGAEVNALMRKANPDIDPSDKDGRQKGQSMGRYMRAKAANIISVDASGSMTPYSGGGDVVDAHHQSSNIAWSSQVQTPMDEHGKQKQMRVNIGGSVPSQLDTPIETYVTNFMLTGNVPCPSGWSEVPKVSTLTGDLNEGATGSKDIFLCQQKDGKMAPITNLQLIGWPGRCPREWERVEASISSTLNGDLNQGATGSKYIYLCQHRGWSKSISEFLLSESNKCPSGWSRIQQASALNGDLNQGATGSKDIFLCQKNKAKLPVTGLKLSNSRTCPSGWSRAQQVSALNGDLNEGATGSKDIFLCQQKGGSTSISNLLLSNSRTCPSGWSRAEQASALDGDLNEGATGSKDIFLCMSGSCKPASTSVVDEGYEHDTYKGWYDVQGCGQCNDYCRWVGSSDPGGRPSKGNLIRFKVGKCGSDPSWWSCHLAGRESGHDTEYGEFQDWPFEKCSGKGAVPPAVHQPPKQPCSALNSMTRRTSAKERGCAAEFIAEEHLRTHDGLNVGITLAAEYGASNLQTWAAGKQVDKVAVAKELGLEMLAVSHPGVALAASIGFALFDSSGDDEMQEALQELHDIVIEEVHEIIDHNKMKSMAWKNGKKMQIQVDALKHALDYGIETETRKEWTLEALKNVAAALRGMWSDIWDGPLGRDGQQGWRQAGTVYAGLSWAHMHLQIKLYIMSLAPEELRSSIAGQIASYAANYSLAARASKNEYLRYRVEQVGLGADLLDQTPESRASCRRLSLSTKLARGFDYECKDSARCHYDKHLDRYTGQTISYPFSTEILGNRRRICPASTISPKSPGNGHLKIPSSQPAWVPHAQLQAGRDYVEALRFRINAQIDPQIYALEKIHCAAATFVDER